MKKQPGNLEKITYLLGQQLPTGRRIREQEATRKSRDLWRWKPRNYGAGARQGGCRRLHDILLLQRSYHMRKNGINSTNTDVLLIVDEE